MLKEIGETFSKAIGNEDLIKIIERPDLPNDYGELQEKKL